MSRCLGVCWVAEDAMTFTSCLHLSQNPKLLRPGALGAPLSLLNCWVAVEREMSPHMVRHWYSDSARLPTLLRGQSPWFSRLQLDECKATPSRWFWTHSKPREYSGNWQSELGVLYHSRTAARRYPSSRGAETAGNAERCQEVKEADLRIEAVTLMILSFSSWIVSTWCINLLSTDDMIVF